MPEKNCSKAFAVVVVVWLFSQASIKGRKKDAYKKLKAAFERDGR